MRPDLIQPLMGFLLMMFAASLIPVTVMSLFETWHQVVIWVSVTVVAGCVGVALWWPHRLTKFSVRSRDGFIIVSLFWIVLSTVSALPLYLHLDIDIADAVFESVSGFTTTGATVLSNLDEMPGSVLYYRQQLQWLGGIGVIVSAVAILPMLGIGGMQLLRAEASGPMKDDKLTPRIGKTAQHLWGIYAALTAACILGYLAAGMTLFDAVCHAMSTISTGGFSTHDASFGFFDSPTIEGIAILFMVIGSIPFTLHYLALRERSLRAYRAHIEVISFIIIVIVAIAVATVTLSENVQSREVLDTLRAAAFAVTTVISTTGFMVEDYTQWPGALPTLLIFISCIGGCAGSTAGGIKVIRIVILARNVLLQTQHLLHPNLVRPLKLDGRALTPKVTDAVWGFFALYVVIFALLMLLAMCGGLDHVSAFGAVAATVNNLGPGLGETSVSFASVEPWLKYVFSLAMLLGRLEFFTLVVLVHPAFWRS
jgi:trk system potassium uptake protein TrkH